MAIITLNNNSLSSVTALPAGVGGKVLQVVNATTTTSTSSTSTSLVDTTLTATITPSSSSNKILVVINQNGISKNNTDSFADMNLRLLRGSTIISSIATFSLFTATAIALNGQTLSTSYLDSPSTTSATTYKTQFSKPDGNSGTVKVQNSDAMSTITLMEIQTWL